MRARIPTIVAALLLCSRAAAQLELDETPARPGEWGFRPADGSIAERTPPPFVWRPQRGAKSYELEVASDPEFTELAWRAGALPWSACCPPRALAPGRWHWRFRFADGEGAISPWSRARTFTIPARAVSFPLPKRGELLARVPAEHPRLFLRPEQIPDLRRRAAGASSEDFAALLATCEALMAEAPATEEPPLYPPGTVRGSDDWRAIWWGNRTFTIRLLNGAATLGFAWRVGERRDCGELARRLLLAAAEWNPKGSTGYRYNDEAGMPYAYHFSRAYTFVHDLLSEDERVRCREVMRVRGKEMYRHLCPGHLWRPYSSHSNRAWHFLGEVAIAFKGEIPEADDWLWFAVNVFACAYPVWSDADGGWHEGAAYWRSYVGRFTWWADVQREALGLDAYELPYFSRAGDYALYLMPPGARGGGFGDLCARLRSKDNRGLMSVLATQARNPHWQWYVDRNGGSELGGGYVGFLRGTRPPVEAVPPTDLPSSRCFRGTGLAMLHSDLLDAREDVCVLFKSSPFGTQSHGYESQNSFLLYAFGERLLIRTGRRDSYGSEHHKRWMWQTRSTNCVTVDGRGQTPHSAAATGRIERFHTSPAIDYVEGQAAPAYAGRLERFTRGILFLKPDLIVVCDRLRSAEPATFEWLLHAPQPWEISGQEDIRLQSGRAACRVSLLAPPDLELGSTDAFDPPPRPRVQLVEHHLTAATRRKSASACFVTAIRPHLASQEPPEPVAIREVPNGYLLEAAMGDGRAIVLLRSAGEGLLAGGGLSTEGEVAAALLDASGGTQARFDSSVAR